MPVIAYLPFPADFTPERIRCKKSDGIDNTRGPNHPAFAGSELIYCCEAQPHMDKWFSPSLFLTLSLTGQHTFGDTFSADRGKVRTFVAPGTLFVVDPMRAHWLYRVDDRLRSVWSAAQWVVSRDEACARARELVAAFGGMWMPKSEIDERYREWAPQGGG